MDLKQAFGVALRQLRNKRNLSQEDFSDISSRTYMSSLERGLKSPTIDKIQQISDVLEIHPVSIMVATYLAANPGTTIDALFERVKSDLDVVD
ncbi:MULTISPECIES: helix-turn-helix domain-containing protein [Pseudomonas]|jgi:transcriptional regulator with XRE-family HTH domain|uniref:XRE family transcriptional regulator n=1 Tax=Pseudomonas neustonica TaxID=2487346 RepID=A0ABX9XD69_9PSED|nr:MULTISPECIES: helix-turn-helix transcriptional regulator [Pseudomonas]MBA6421261.1 helix-turn-helix transcriptional regulator [Pseudomonas sp. 5Ae-yellow]ROZ80134.1 XRE family transcriptional regulator [Pseudomonas sp. SSM44]ROZ80220.1 XRE family transcriptional regulator [Pseudomonas sp. SSM44]ROZ80755.1 XRE family transcriptional regulator [Pseudomonas neustonica]ROZ80976.1 XRE family transcriptional regulator [Pseudomonas neustonica]|tara:strand:+ start:4064 stop:4342 length:279 start_codon:yes stop_codon:yes gene_type:complete